MVCEHALTYASHGLRVLPIKPASKIPAVRSWTDKATCDRSKIRRWFSGRNSGRNIGLAMGNGIFAIDVDVKDGGINSFLCLIGDEELPDTANAVTASGGCHYLFRTAEQIGNSVGILPGVDLRGNGGQIVVAPSVISFDEYYRWVDHPGDGIAEAPAWLLEKLVNRASETGHAPLRTDKTATSDEYALLIVDVVTKFPVHEVGTRNGQMARVVASLVCRGYDEAMTYAVALDWWSHFAEQGVIGTPFREAGRTIRATIRSAMKSTKLRPSVSVDHRANVRAVKITQGQVGLCNSLASMGHTTRARPTNHTVITSSLDAVFVEALVVHFLYERSKTEGPLLPVTHGQVAEIILDRHGRKFGPQQWDRMQAKYVTRDGKPASSIELAVRLQRGSTGKPSLYELTGLSAFLDCTDDHPSIALLEDLASVGS